MQGHEAQRDDCDVAESNTFSRLCWQAGLDSSNIESGWRGGANTFLNDSTDFRRAIFVPRPR